MKTLKYTVIKYKKQYDEYCKLLEDLIKANDKIFSDEIDLLTVLIEKWDHEHNSFIEADPIELIKSLMDGNNLKARDLCEVLNLTKGTTSKILNYQKGLSKETIRKLSDFFKISQEAFNRPYKLVGENNKRLQNNRLMNSKKKMNKKTTSI